MTTSPLGESQEVFLARVRKALGRAQTQPPEPPAPAVDESLARLASDDDDLLGLFAQRAEAVGMNIHRTRQDNLPQTLKGILAALEARRIVLGFGDAGESVNLAQAVAAAPVEIVDWHAAAGLEPQYDTDAGVTDVHAALAETGTLVCCADPQHSRGLSLVPPKHIAVVRRSDILPDMIDYWAKRKNNSCDAVPSSIVFITGPSKTSDIEGVLVTGVHGPGQVHIVLVEDA